MRGRPLHPDPVVSPPALSAPQEWSAPLPRPAGPGIGAVSASGVGGAAQPSAVGEGLPHLMVDHAVAGQIKRQVSDKIAQARKTNPLMSPASQEQQARAWINEAVAFWADAAAAQRGVSPSPAEETALGQAVFDRLFRAGRLQPYLDDARVENIFINGHEDVWLDLSGGRREQVAPVADSEEELLELLRDLARNTEGQSERTISTASPFLPLRLRDGSRLQAITAPASPQTYVTIRRHRVQDAGLADMARLGTVDPVLAQFLSACVKAEKNLAICGPQAAGKTSLMRALLKEIPVEERFATIETEFELFAHTDGHHQQVVAMEARESNGERGPDGRAVGEITLMDLMYRALRMSLTRIVVGEVRGPEIVAMLQAMTNGAGGNLCTLHAKHPDVVFDRIAELYLLAQGNMSEQLAYRQIANGLDFIVFVSLVDETRTGGARHRFVSHVLEVTGMGEMGRPAVNQIFTPGVEFGEPRAVPRMHPACMDDLRRAGFPAHLLDAPQGGWERPLMLRVAAS
ncbi:CpaF/VirB11 family protein [Streptomyces sp. ET3-23]|nr:CpaF/VirB11 family protein [Streptomyces sp. ET3-23]MCC2280847.1 CpaF/VirB11 family protein [Streptomyces sp. ET3-23]